MDAESEARSFGEEEEGETVRGAAPIPTIITSLLLLLLLLITVLHLI